jgi:hypothetical protein
MSDRPASNLPDLGPVKVGSVVLRGVTVPLNTDVGQAFVADCARHTEGFVSDSDIQNKWGLTEQDWAGLAANTQLLNTVKTGRERRILSGEATREAAQWQFAKAPDVLGSILTGKLVSPRHQIEAAKELRQIAGNGPNTPRPGEKFNIVINLGSEVLRFEETIRPLDDPPFDEGGLT